MLGRWSQTSGAILRVLEKFRGWGIAGRSRPLGVGLGVGWGIVSLALYGPSVSCPPRDEQLPPPHVPTTIKFCITMGSKAGVRVAVD